MLIGVVSDHHLCETGNLPLLLRMMLAGRCASSSRAMRMCLDEPIGGSVFMSVASCCVHCCDSCVALGDLVLVLSVTAAAFYLQFTGEEGEGGGGGGDGRRVQNKYHHACPSRCREVMKFHVLYGVEKKAGDVIIQEATSTRPSSVPFAMRLT
ncbi:hypothetical protein BaRGS_00013524 [Batillaria attramentaria]|uniref:Uncharacterized protein n=1 Tax=Batillaria attramentaria TaxID=370345 RepID=A0ABD0L854_9CAEN